MKTLHGYSGEYDPRDCKHKFASLKTFSLGIFPILPKASGKGMKKGTVVVRVSGPTSKPEAVAEKAREIIKLLDAREYTGPKRVRVR